MLTSRTTVLKNLIRLAVLASLATSSIIPPPITTHGTGVTVVSSSTPVKKSLERRWLGNEVYCGCGIGLTTEYTNNVVNAIAANNYILDAGARFMAVQGDVTAFICYDGSDEGVLLGYDFLFYMQHVVSPICGSFIAGTWEFMEQTRDFYIGYMRYAGESAEQICAAARGSPARIYLASPVNLPFIC